jgi:hypothetical protein
MLEDLNTARSKAVEMIKIIERATVKPSDKSMSALSNALYTISQGGGWPDYVDSVSVDQALLCWRLVEWLKVLDELPSEFKL